MSDSPLPIPSGYFCHTSCAIGKGRQPQQYDCPLPLPRTLSADVVGYPNFTPEGQYLLITLEGIVPCTFSFRALYIPVPLEKKEKKTATVFPWRRQDSSQLFSSTRDSSLAREAFSRDFPRATKTHPVTLYSWELMSRSYVARECVDRSKGEFDETWKHNICVARDSSER